jgi:hypothetical protein
MRLRVDSRTGEVILTIPRRVSRRKALSWAEEQREWVEEALAAVPECIRLTPGGEIPLHGEPHIIAWSSQRSRTVTVQNGAILVGGPLEMLEARLLRWLRRQALEYLERDTRSFALQAGVSVARVGVGDPISRWGSCSSSGAIRYSWRLILAPDWVRRATVAHEVAHRVHMNHGPEFHALVERLLGADPRPARKWLRVNGARLARIGPRR